jgi:hypothetical protein
MSMGLFCGAEAKTIDAGHATVSWKGKGVIDDLGLSRHANRDHPREESSRWLGTGADPSNQNGLSGDSLYQ